MQISEITTRYEYCALIPKLNRKSWELEAYKYKHKQDDWALVYIKLAKVSIKSLNKPFHIQSDVISKSMIHNSIFGPSESSQ